MVLSSHKAFKHEKTSICNFVPFWGQKGRRLTFFNKLNSNYCSTVECDPNELYFMIIGGVLREERPIQIYIRREVGKSRFALYHVCLQRERKTWKYDSRMLNSKGGHIHSREGIRFRASLITLLWCTGHCEFDGPYPLSRLSTFNGSKMRQGT